MLIRQYHIVIYVFITLIFVICVNNYISNNQAYRVKIDKIDDNYQKLNAALTAADSKNILLVIGNSYVHMSFDGTVAGENVIKFTVPAMSLGDMVNIVENLPIESSISKILVGLSYNYAIPTNPDSVIYDKHHAENPVSAFWLSLPIVRGRSMISAMVKEDLICFLAHALKIQCGKNDNEQGGGILDTDTPAKNYSTEVILSIKDILRKFAPFTASVDPNFGNYIQRLKVACEIRNIVLMAYTAPIYKELRDQLDIDSIEKFRATISAKEVNYVDLNLIYPDWDAGMFKDAAHMNETVSSPITTRFLLDHVVYFND